DLKATRHDVLDVDEFERLRRFRAGDVVTARSLLGEYHRGLYTYALSLTADPAGSEDIVQEAFLRLLTYEKRNPMDSIRGFLFTVTRNLAANEAKRASVRRRN